MIRNSFFIIRDHLSRRDDQQNQRATEELPTSCNGKQVAPSRLKRQTGQQEYSPCVQGRKREPFLFDQLLLEQLSAFLELVLGQRITSPSWSARLSPITPAPCQQHDHAHVEPELASAWRQRVA